MESVQFQIDSLSGATLGWIEFIDKSRRLAAELQYLGCERDTIVGIISENRIEYPIVYLGTLLTGSILNFFDPVLFAGEYMDYTVHL